METGGPARSSCGSKVRRLEPAGVAILLQLRRARILEQIRVLIILEALGLEAAELAEALAASTKVFVRGREGRRQLT